MPNNAGRGRRWWFRLLTNETGNDPVVVGDCEFQTTIVLKRNSDICLPTARLGKLTARVSKAQCPKLWGVIGSGANESACLYKCALSAGRGPLAARIKSGAAVVCIIPLNPFTYPKSDFTDNISPVDWRIGCRSKTEASTIVQGRVGR